MGSLELGSHWRQPKPLEQEAVILSDDGLPDYASTKCGRRMGSIVWVRFVNRTPRIQDAYLHRATIKKYWIKVN